MYINTWFTNLNINDMHQKHLFKLILSERVFLAECVCVCTSQCIISNTFYLFLFIFIHFLAIDCCRFCVVIRFFSPPPQRPMTSDFEGFLYQILSITLFSYLNSWERGSIFPFQCWVLSKGTTQSGTIFITSLVWRGPWLGIEPGTSRTRSQPSTTRLSKRRS